MLSFHKKDSSNRDCRHEYIQINLITVPGGLRGLTPELIMQASQSSEGSVRDCRSNPAHFSPVPQNLGKRRRERGRLSFDVFAVRLVPRNPTGHI